MPSTNDCCTEERTVKTSGECVPGFKTCMPTYCSDLEKKHLLNYPLDDDIMDAAT